MKNYIFLFFTLFVFNKSVSQCTVKLDDLLKATRYSLSDFETFALINGYSYNSLKNNYMCDTEYLKEAHLTLTRFTDNDNSVTITYMFFQKSNYLEYKQTLEKFGKFHSSEVKNGVLTTLYIYNKRLIQLETRTYNDVNIYMVTMSSTDLN